MSKNQCGSWASWLTGIAQLSRAFPVLLTLSNETSWSPIIATLSLTTGAFTQNTTGPASQSDNMSTDGISKDGMMKKDGMSSGSRSNDDMSKNDLKKEMSKDGWPADGSKDIKK
jgi:pentapeptide MXKDX repeat protein